MQTRWQRGVLVLPLLALGCDPAAVPADAAPSVDAATSGSDLAFHLVGWAGTGSTGPALAGFEVLVDQPDGTRLMATTDAAGRATVPDFTWGGPVALTFWGPGYAIQTITDMDQATFESWLVDGELTEVLMPLAYPSVTGTVRNMQDESHAMMVGALHGGLSIASGPSYSLQALAGHPLVLVATELAVASGAAPQVVQWAVTTGPAPAAGSTLEIDMTADAVTPRPFSGSYPVPESLRGLDIEIDVQVDAAHVGLPTESGWSTDGTRVEYVGEYVEVPTDADVEIRSFFGMSDGRGSGSFVHVRGYPRDGMQDIVLPPIPTLVPFSPRTVRDPIEITEGQPGMFLVGKVFGPDEVPRWVLYSARTGGTRLELPELPAAALAQVSEAGSAAISVYACEMSLTRERWRWCDRAAVLRPFDIDTTP